MTTTTTTTTNTIIITSSNRLTGPFTLLTKYQIFVLAVVRGINLVLSPRDQVEEETVDR